MNLVSQAATAASSASDLDAITTDRAASVKRFTFLAIYGIAACVSFILYSKKTNRCALAHFDDPFNVTIIMPEKEKISAQYTEKMTIAKHHYRASIQKILTQAQHGFKC